MYNPDIMSKNALFLQKLTEKKLLRKQKERKSGDSYLQFTGIRRRLGGDLLVSLFPRFFFLRFTFGEAGSCAQLDFVPCFIELPFFAVTPTTPWLLPAFSSSSLSLLSLFCRQETCSRDIHHATLSDSRSFCRHFVTFEQLYSLSAYVCVWERDFIVNS